MVVIRPSSQRHLRENARIQRWPADGLENLGRCPVCDSEIRSVLYESLTDKTFCCAPGSWTLFGCGQCGCAYLDPRPTLQTISLAYRRYYTHEKIDPPEGQRLDLLRRLKRLAVNGYMNLRWKTGWYPSSTALGVLLGCFPALRARLDGERMRYLPVPGLARELLDVGCGNGEFLYRARSAGWRTTGLDLDERAIESARSKGINALHGGVEILREQEGRFDAITLSHVIEHVHDPKALLEACYRLLKTGGFFLVETPNLDSLGHSKFASCWRGLEPPRHLVMFRRDNLLYLLRSAGFTNIRATPWRPELLYIYHASKAISADLPIRTPSLVDRAASYILELPARFSPALREYITLIATKGDTTGAARR